MSNANNVKMMTEKEFTEYENSDQAAHTIPPKLHMYSVAEISTANPVYKGTGIKQDMLRKKENERTLLIWSPQGLKELLLDKCIPEQTANQIVQMYSENEDKNGTGKIVYNWTSRTMIKKRMAIPTYSVRALIGILTTIMPQPVQAIRNALLHGNSAEEMYTEEMSTILDFAVFISKPYAVRKIMAFEAEKNGGQIRSIHRSTDMGQQGRRFSESDIEDLINRTVLMSFCPLICRSVPVTDRGNGYLILTDCTVESWVGEKMITTHQVSMSSMTGRADRLNYRLKHYLCTEEQYAAATIQQRRKVITRRMYNDQMSKLRYPKVKVTRPAVHHIRNGFYVQWTCNLTGQKFIMFTRSAERMNRLVKCTAICAELESGVQKSTVNKGFGNSIIPTELMAETVRPYTPEGVYFKTLKFTMYNLFEYLFRRSVNIQEGLEVHKKTKMIGRNNECTPLYELQDSDILNSVQKLVIKTELALTEELPKCSDHRERRVEMYRELWSMENNNKPCRITRRQYTDLRNTVLEELKELWESEKSAPALPDPVLLYGTPVIEEKEIGILEIPSGAMAMHYSHNEHLFSSEISVRALVKRSDDELTELSGNPNVRKFSEYKTVQVSIPCWETTAGHLYIEQNHDDV